MKMYEKTFFGENSKINFSEGPENGETIILIHALGSSWKSWNPIINLIMEKYHLIAIDLIGHGKSGKCLNDYTWENYSIEVSHFIKFNSFKSVNLLGHSLGGIVAALCSIKEESVKTLCMEDPPIFINRKIKPNKIFQIFKKQMFLSKKGFDLEYTTNEILKFSPAIKREVAMSRAKNILSADYKIWEIILFGDIVGINTPEKIIPRINVPTLIFRANPNLNGVISQDNEKMLSHIKVLEIEFWENCGHNMHSSFPEKFSSRYLSFLNKNRN